MVFSSAVFLLVFLPVTLGLYFLLPIRFRNVFLFAASLLFYAWGEPRYVLIMLFSTLFDYGNGLALEKWDARPVLRRLILIFSIVVNVGLLCFFKYTNFAISTISDITGLSLSLLHIALPVGISFYTFQTLSYTIDVYRRQVKAQHNIIDFGMYISMFPQLIAGPIVRYIEIEKSLKNRASEAQAAAQGAFRFVTGLCKKVLIANQLGPLWDEIYRKNGDLPALTAWIGALAFAFQIYFDFSGYSDMAIGIGRMLGFSLPENFRYPYEAHSITDFWRRWHITLGTWFREYVYIPLGGNRRGIWRQVFNLLVVWFLTGLWHGAGVHFILWGLYFFVLLSAEKLFLSNFLKKLPHIATQVYTLFFVLISWVIFACDDLSSLRIYLPSLFGAGGFVSLGSWYFLRNYGAMLLFAAICCTHAPRTLCRILIQKVNLSQKSIFCFKAFFTLAALLLCVVFVIADSYNPFLYFRF